MSRDLQTYGITTFNQSIGASAVVAIGGEASVLDTVFLGVTGSGVISISGVSTAVGGSVIASGCEVRSGAIPLSVGASRVYLAASAAATIQILQKLSNGFSRS